MIEAKKEGRLCYLSFTIGFCAVGAVLLFFFLFYGRSMVWDCDGVYQHFNSFVYYGEYLRGILKNLWENHTLSIPMWDMRIGYGADILTTLNYYGFGDPLSLLSVLVRPEKAEYMYAFVAVLRLYLSGCFFLIYCRYHHNGAQASVLGALSYCFSGFALFVFARHPAFANPMIYFPLILLGIDLVFAGKKPWLFIWSIAIMAICNFYFFYMACILMVVYAGVRYCMLFGRIRPKELAGWFLKFTLYFAGGMGIAAITFLPSAMYVLNTGRMNVDNRVPLFYPLTHYASLFREFFQVTLGTERSNTYTLLGMTPLVLTSVFVLFLKRKRFTHLKIGFFILSAFFLLPFFGHMLNGFSYASNRWSWGYAMLLAYILVKMYPQFFDLKKGEKKGLLILCTLYVGVTLAIPRSVTPHIACSLFVLLVMALLAYFLTAAWAAKFLPLLYGGITLLAIAFNIVDLYGPAGSNYVSEFRARGKPYDMLTTDSQSYPVKALEDNDGFYRYDQYGVVSHENTSMQTGVSSTDFYFSVTNKDVTQYFEDLGVCVRVEQMYDNLDNRSTLERLAAVRYFVAKNASGTVYVPYSYDEKVGGNKKFAVYKSDEALPFGYTYAYAVSPETFASLPVERKQQVLLQGAVTQNSSLPEAELVFQETRPQLTIVPGENVTIDSNKFVVAAAGAEIQIEFEGLANSETYLVLQNLRYSGAESSFSLCATSGKTEKLIPVYTSSHNFYSGKDDFAINLGYRKKARTRITLKFSAVGTYSADEFYVYCQPMGSIDEQTEALRQEVLEDVVFSDNRIEGTINLENGARMLTFPMAYSKGWHVFVDGAEQELKKVNLMFPGVELPEGSHQIELRYETPYLRAGVCISLFSLLTVLFFMLSKRKSRGVA